MSFLIRFERVHYVHCSGGHFNPAVSLSAYLCGGMELLLLVPYVLAQVLGGVAGAGLTRVRKTVAALFVQEKEIIDPKKMGHSENFNLHTVF